MNEAMKQKGWRATSIDSERQWSQIIFAAVAMTTKLPIKSERGVENANV